MKNFLFLALSLVFFQLAHGREWWRSCNAQKNHGDYGKRYPSDILSLDVSITPRKGSSANPTNLGCSVGNQGCKIPARSTLDITLNLKSLKSARKIKATLQGRFMLLWHSVEMNKLKITCTSCNNSKSKRIKKNQQYKVKFQYTLPLTGFRGMKMPTAIRITGKRKQNKDIVIGCVVFSMNIV